MANNDGWVAGRYSLNAVTLRKFSGGASVPIINEIVGFNIFESMKSPAMHGTVTVFDKKNLMRDFDIKGEEVIEFDYADWWGHQRIMTFFVYGISNVRYPDDDRSNGAFIQYTLNFVSAEKVFTEDKAVMKSYKGRKISDYVQEVYDEFYVGSLKKFQPKRISIQPTTGELDLVIPNLTPEQTMEFFARRAFSSESRNSMFRFFENRNGFFFGDPDFISRSSLQLDASDVTPKYFYNIKGDISAEGQESVMRTIMSAHFGDKVNTVDDIDSGGYRRQLVELDMITGIVGVRSPSFDIIPDFQSPREKVVHDPSFVNEVMNLENPRRIFVFKDYASAGQPGGDFVPPDRFLSEILEKRPTYEHHYRYNTVQITIHGDNSLFVGGLIDLEFDERHEPDGKVPQVDKERSGRYYIESIDNIFFNNMYMQKCTVSRFGVGK